MAQVFIQKKVSRLKMVNEIVNVIKKGEVFNKGWGGQGSFVLRHF
jgi:hypothetical protein